MVTLRIETRKIVRSAATLVYFAACLAFNAFMILSCAHTGEIDSLNDFSLVTGTRYGPVYSEKLAGLTRPSGAAYTDMTVYVTLVNSEQGPASVYADWDSQALIRTVNGSNRLSDTAKRLLSDKFSALGKSASAILEGGGGDDVYFAGLTGAIHEDVVVMTVKLLTAETCVYAVLAMLLSLGYEEMAATSQVILATKTGRRIAAPKILAGVIAATIFFIVLATLTWAGTFAANDYSLVWGQSVSARHHIYRDPVLSAMPFTTWSPMTISGWIRGAMAVSLLNAMVSAAFAALFGLLVKNTYAAFCCIAGAAFTVWILGVMVNASEGNLPFWWHMTLLTPVAQTLNSGLWFSDGGTLMLFRHFELLAPALCLTALAPPAAICAKKYSRKDM